MSSATKIIEIKLKFDQDIEDHLKKTISGLKDYRIIKKSLDARRANTGKVPSYLYRVEVSLQDLLQEDTKTYPQKKQNSFQPVIIGMGPAGLFCALQFLKYGIKPILIDRGEPVHKRMKTIAKFWKYGDLNEESNVCYGEGGAGLFSDGKLNTRIKSPWAKEILKDFIKFGAPKEILYMNDPHVGSNLIRKVIEKLTQYLKEMGCELHYDCTIKKFTVENKNEKKYLVSVHSNYREIFGSHFILATGHSERHLYYYLNELGAALVPKDFAVGFRVEHPRFCIDQAQFGAFAQKGLGAARYKLTFFQKSTQHACYSFCMCPGGYVLSSGTEKDGLVTNGMSNFSKSSPWSNAALIVPVKHGVDFDGDVFAGLNWQMEMEKKAFQLSKDFSNGIKLPAITVKDFIKNQWKQKKLDFKVSCPSGVFLTDLNSFYSEHINRQIKEGIEYFNQKIPGFIRPDSLLIAPETRTSSPLKILRNKETLASDELLGLYPCGEGAGVAGGIISAAVDGVKVCESIIHHS